MEEKPLVLIAEDEKTLIPIFRQIVEGMGARVVMVESAEDAMCLDVEIPDVVITDIGLADGKTSGFGVIDHFVPLGVPVVVISGTPPAEPVALQKGAIAFIEKPFGPGRLMEVLKPLIEVAAAEDPAPS